MLIFGACKQKVVIPVEENHSFEQEKIDSLVLKSYMAKGEVVLMQTTLGSIYFTLYEETPRHKANFLTLIDKNFYDSLLFHRVMPAFMVQAGDPDSRNAASKVLLGSGGPGYVIEQEIVDSLLDVRGALAAARMTDEYNPERSSNGSQFYFVVGKRYTENEIQGYAYEKGFRYGLKSLSKYLESAGVPFLDHDYSVFGQAFHGLDVIEQISSVECDKYNRPFDDIRILSVKVLK